MRICLAFFGRRKRRRRRMQNFFSAGGRRGRKERGFEESKQRKPERLPSFARKEEKSSFFSFLSRPFPPPTPPLLFSFAHKLEEEEEEKEGRNNLETGGGDDGRKEEGGFFLLPLVDAPPRASRSRNGPASLLVLYGPANAMLLSSSSLFCNSSSIYISWPISNTRLVSLFVCPFPFPVDALISSPVKLFGSKLFASPSSSLLVRKKVSKLGERESGEKGCPKRSRGKKPSWKEKNVQGPYKKSWMPLTLSFQLFTLLKWDWHLLLSPSPSSLQSPKQFFYVCEWAWSFPIVLISQQKELKKGSSGVEKQLLKFTSTREKAFIAIGFITKTQLTVGMYDNSVWRHKDEKRLTKRPCQPQRQLREKPSSQATQRGSNEATKRSQKRTKKTWEKRKWENNFSSGEKRSPFLFSLSQVDISLPLPPLLFLVSLGAEIAVVSLQTSQRGGQGRSCEAHKERKRRKKRRKLTFWVNSEDASEHSSLGEAAHLSFFFLSLV